MFNNSAKRLSTYGAQECSINGNNSAKRLSTYGAQEGLSLLAMQSIASIIIYYGVAYIIPIHLNISLRFATTMSRSKMPMPMYSAQIIKFSLGLRRVIIS